MSGMLDGERPLRAFIRPIADDLRDPRVTEIVCQTPGEVGVERDGKWEWRTVPEFTYERLEQIGMLCADMTGDEFDPDHPIVHTTLPDGQRLTMARPPVQPPGTIAMTIRVPSEKERTVDDDDMAAMMEGLHRDFSSEVDAELLALYEAAVYSNDYSKFYRRSVEAGMNIVVTGKVKSGKTTFVKRLMRSIPPDERVITAEDGAEFGPLPHVRNRVSHYFGKAGVSAEDVLKLTLREGPDRVALQELRGPEAFAFMRAMMTGFTGALTTFHAPKGHVGAFDALAVMIRTHPDGKEIPDEKLGPLLRQLIDVIVHCENQGGKFVISDVWFRGTEEKAARERAKDAA